MLSHIRCEGMGLLPYLRRGGMIMLSHLQREVMKRNLASIMIKITLNIFIGILLLYQIVSKC